MGCTDDATVLLGWVTTRKRVSGCWDGPTLVFGPPAQSGQAQRPRYKHRGVPDCRGMPSCRATSGGFAGRASITSRRPRSHSTCGRRSRTRSSSCTSAARRQSMPIARAHPAMNPTRTRTMVTALMGVPFCEESRSNLRALRDRPRCLVNATLRRLGAARRWRQASGSPGTAGECLRPSETVRFAEYGNGSKTRIAVRFEA
jgi:hypothetical protein